MSVKTIWRFRTVTLLKIVLLVLLMVVLGPHFFHLAVLACGGGGSDPPIPSTPANSLVVSISGAGSVTVNPYGTGGPSQVVTSSAQIKYTTPRNVSLTANPSSGWVFGKWEETQQTTAAINPYITGTKYFTAVFKSISPNEDPSQWVYLQTNVSPSGALAAGCKVSPSGKSKHARSSEVPLKPQGAGGWTFSSWDGANGDDIDDVNDPAMIVMDSDKEVTAVFVQKFVLTRSTKGKGVVTATPAGPTYGAGTTVEVEAEADPNGWNFVEWQNDASGTENPTDVVMNADKHAKAVFSKANTKSLTVTTPEGSKIRIQASPNGTSNGTNPTEPGTTVLQFTSTSTVTLQARVFQEYRGQGFRFVRWQGDVPAGQESNNPITITVDSDKSIEPVLGETFRLKVETEGPGSVTINAPPGTQINDTRYIAGTEIGLSATPPQSLVEWEGSIGGRNPEETITLDSNKYVLAQFYPGIGDAPLVIITAASFRPNSASSSAGVLLCPIGTGLSGTLKMTLEGSGSSYQFLNETRASGFHPVACATASIPPGTYDTVRARWSVSGHYYYDEFDIDLTISDEADDDPNAAPSEDDDTDPIADQADEDQEPQEDSPTEDQENNEADPLLLHSGEFKLREVDLRIKGRGMDFVWARTYRSKIPSSTYLGKNWDFSYNTYLKRITQDVILLHDGSRARRDKFYHVGSGLYEKNGFFGHLQENPDESYTLYFADGSKWRFAPITPPLSGSSPEIGKITQIEDRNGNSITFAYDILKNLESITDTMGKTIHLDYWNNRIARVRCDTREVEYTYFATGDSGGPQGDLKSVRSPIVLTGFPQHDFPQGKVRTYTYSKGYPDSARNHNLLTITNGQGVTYLQNIYSSESNEQAFNYDRVVQQIWGRVTDGIDNDSVNLAYVENPAPPPGAPSIQAAVKTIVNDRNGHVTEYYYDSQNQTLLAREYTGSADPLAVTTESQNRPTSKLRATDPEYFDTRMIYNPQGLTSSVTYPNGNWVSYQYDSGSRIKEGNLLTITYSSGDSLSFEYLNGYGSGNLRDFITRMVDANENVTKHFYDSIGNRIGTEEWNAAETELLAEHDFTYNSSGQLTSHTHPSNGTSHRFDAFVYEGGNGYLSQIIVDSGGADLTTVFVRGDYGEVIQKTDPYGNVTEYVVNELDQVVRETAHIRNGYGETRSYQTDYYFDGVNRIAQVVRQDTVILSDAISVVLTYDELGKILSETRYKGGYSTVSGSWLDPVTTTLEYDDNRNLIGLVSPEGRETRFVYDERDLLYERHDGYASPDVRVTRLVYDGNKNLLEAIVAPGPDQRVYSYSHDVRNRLRTINDPMDNTIEYLYDDKGNTIFAQRRDPGEQVVYESTGVYDSLNRLTTRHEKIINLGSSPPAQTGVATTSFTYNPDSSIAQITNPNDHTIAIAYDSVGRRDSVSDELGNLTTYTYSQLSGVQVVTETRLDRSDLAALQIPGFADQLIQSEIHFDGLNRPIKVIEKRTQGADLLTRFNYDCRGNRTHFVDARGYTSLYVFDGLDRVVESQLPQGTSLTQTWDDDSLLMSEVDGLGHATSYTYDALRRPRQVTTADNEIYSYQYNLFDEITIATDAIGSQVALLRDDLGRVIQRAVSPAVGISGPAVPEVFSYDALSDLVYAENDDAVVERAFDSRGYLLEESLTFKSDSAEYSTTSGFDDAGNLISIGYPGGKTVTQTFDALERLSSVASNQGGALATYRYIGSGSRVERRILGNGAWVDFAFDNLGRTVGSADRKPDGLGGEVVLDARSYAWDGVHNRTARADTRAGGPETAFTYQYDSLSRLTQSILTPGTGDPVTRSYAFDEAGNRDAVTVTVGQGAPVVEDYALQGSDALINAYTVTPFDMARMHDANGNLTLRTLSPSSEVAFGYDYRNLMVSRSQTDPAQTAQYTYDALGRRIEKTVGQDVTRYVYHGARVIEERDGAGELLGSYVYGSYLDEVLSLRRASADYYYHSDDQWNTVALTDANGDVVERYEYGDYGEPEFYDAAGNPLSGSTVGNPCLFTGQRFDTESGLYWYKFRYLDPQTGRFTSRDPLGLWGDPLNLGNPYTYTGNRPWTYLDPYGLCGEDGEEADNRSLEDKLNDTLQAIEDAFGDWIREVTGINDLNPFDDIDGIDHLDEDFYTSDAAGSGNLNPLDAYRQMAGGMEEKLHQGAEAGMETGIALATGAAGKGLGGLADDAVDVGHHSIPRASQKQLGSEATRKHPDVRGRRGNPNIRRVSEQDHIDAHSSPPGNYYPGGAYNRRFDELVERRGGYDKITPEQLNEIRDQVMDEFFGK